MTFRLALLLFTHSTGNRCMVIKMRQLCTFFAPSLGVEWRPRVRHYFFPSIIHGFVPRSLDEYFCVYNTNVPFTYVRTRLSIDMGAARSFHFLQSDDASIELDNPHIYSPGDIVSGTLHLKHRDAHSEPVSIDLIGEIDYIVASALPLVAQPMKIMCLFSKSQHCRS
jgi:hypothetical protein